MSHQVISKKRRKERKWSCSVMSNCSLLGSSIHGIFQVRVLQWVATSFSRGSSQPRDGTQAISRIWIIHDSHSKLTPWCSCRYLFSWIWYHYVAVFQINWLTWMVKTTSYYQNKLEKPIKIITAILKQKNFVKAYNKPDFLLS